MDNTSSNYNPQGDDYKIFIDRYKDSLIPENGQYNDNKADIYLKSIVKKVENEYNHDQYDSNIKLNFDKGYKAKDEDVKNFIDDSITQVTTIKYKLKKQQIPKNVNLIYYHGMVWDRMKIVPEGCILCILTPLNRLSIINITTFIELEKLKELIKQKTFYDEFSKNPMCYGKTIYDGLFYYADIYFPGQFYYDLLLSTKNDEQLAYTGIYSNTTQNTETIKDFINTKTKKISEGYNETAFNLSHFLKSITDLGIVLVKCCRYLNTNKNFGINEVKIMYRYEHFLNLLNKSVMIPDDNDFNNCDLITSFEKESYFQPQKHNNHKKNSKLQILQNNNKNNKYIGNKTIGINYKDQKRKSQICNDKQIINNFYTINYLSGDLSDDYDFAWKSYILCTKHPYEKEALKFLIDNGVNMNVFFSCAISKLLYDENERTLLKQIYDNLEQLGVTITSIYLNGINLETIPGNLIFFILNNTNLKDVITELHLQNTNIKFTNIAFLFFKHVEGDKNANIPSEFKNIKVLDISNNKTINSQEINDFIEQKKKYNNFKIDLSKTLDGKSIKRNIPQSTIIKKPLQTISLPIEIQKLKTVPPPPIKTQTQKEKVEKEKVEKEKVEKEKVEK